jgi:hypothetical protein
MKATVPCDVLNGVLVTDDLSFDNAMSWGRCANPRCQRVFLPRADGDKYCCDACDLDDNPDLKGCANVETEENTMAAEARACGA